MNIFPGDEFEIFKFEDSVWLKIYSVVPADYIKE